MKEHTRNQKRMYRIHKQEEKILEQELLISSLQNQLQQKENIIKEVREYITSAIENDDIEELKSARHLTLWNEDLDKLLEILDKVD